MNIQDPFYIVIYFLYCLSRKNCLSKKLLTISYSNLLHNQSSFNLTASSFQKNSVKKTGIQGTDRFEEKKNIFFSTLKSIWGFYWPGTGSKFIKFCGSGSTHITVYYPKEPELKINSYIMGDFFSIGVKKIKNNTWDWNFLV